VPPTHRFPSMMASRAAELEEKGKQWRCHPAAKLLSPGHLLWIAQANRPQFRHDHETSIPRPQSGRHVRAARRLAQTTGRPPLDLALCGTLAAITYTIDRVLYVRRPKPYISPRLVT